MHDAVETVGEAVHHLAVALALQAVPDPGTGEPPPGSQKLLLLLRWIAWVVTGMCVAGLFGVAAGMALQHQRGEGGRHAAALAWVAAACILLGSASGVVSALI